MAGRPVQRVGDSNSRGGIITGGITSVLVNGRPIAVVNNRVTAHPCCGKKGCPPIHCSAVTGVGSNTVRAGGRPVNLTGIADTCGDVRVGGSPNVRAG